MDLEGTPVLASKSSHQRTWVEPLARGVHAQRAVLQKQRGLQLATASLRDLGGWNLKVKILSLKGPRLKSQE